MKKKIFRLAAITASLLLIPIAGMRFSDGWNWTLFDFAFASMLIFGTGLAYELVAKRFEADAYKLGCGIALAAAFLLVWVNGAVGIIGSEDNAVNLMYFGVLAVGMIGVFLARLEPRKMAHALFAAAFAQMMVPVIAYFVARPQIVSEEPGAAGIFALNAFFAMLFMLSGIAFRNVRETRPAQAPLE